MAEEEEREYIHTGATIRGEILVFEGRKVGKMQIIQRGVHRNQRVILKNGRCWIEKPMRFVP